MRTRFSIFPIAAAVLIAASFHASSQEPPVIVALPESGQGAPQDDRSRRTIRRDSAPAISRASNIEFAFDAGEKQISAVQFLISSDADLSRADLSNCTAMLPDTHVGDCKVKGEGEGILFYAFSPVNAPLPDGVLGSISVDGGRNVRVEISDQVMADVDGVELDID